MFYSELYCNQKIFFKALLKKQTKKKKAKKLKDQDINWIVHMDSEVIHDGG